jgi:hypothetical protein
MAAFSRHPERSRLKGGAVEGPLLSMQQQKQVPTLRLATLGSGRDDGVWVPSSRDSLQRSADRTALKF